MCLAMEEHLKLEDDVLHIPQTGSFNCVRTWHKKLGVTEKLPLLYFYTVSFQQWPPYKKKSPGIGFMDDRVICFFPVISLCGARRPVTRLRADITAIRKIAIAFRGKLQL